VCAESGSGPGVIAQQLTGPRAIVTVAVACLLVQIVSASAQRRSFESPNLASDIAHSLVARGEFDVGGRRAYQLPGAPMYLALGFSLLPDPLHRYVHVPVAVVLASALASVALALAGPAAAVTAGLVATLDPFVVLHGPVWDDTFLAAALEWATLGLLVGVLASVQRPGNALTGALVLLAALTSLTRTQSPVILMTIGTAVTLAPSMRYARRAGIAVLAGVILALAGWGARNAVVLGTFYMGTTRDGKALYEANCAYTRQGIRELGVVGGFLERCGPAEAAHVAHLGEVAADAQLRRYAIDYITSHPTDVAKTAAFKLSISLTGFDYASPPASGRNVGGLIASVAILGTGLWGLCTWRWRGAIGQLVAVAATATATVTLVMLLIGPVGLRYRISFTGFLYLGTGLLLASVVERATGRLKSGTMVVHVTAR
jgi:hypothetical protein